MLSNRQNEEQASDMIKMANMFPVSIRKMTPGLKETQNLYKKA